MSSINVSFLGHVRTRAIIGRTTRSFGRKTMRVNLMPGWGAPHLQVAMMSGKIYQRPPKPSFLEIFFGLRYVVVRIESDKGHGYIKLNSGSLRKRLGINSKVFKDIVKHSNRNVTDKIKPFIDYLTTYYKSSTKNVQSKVDREGCLDSDELSREVVIDLPEDR